MYHLTPKEQLIAEFLHAVGCANKKQVHKMLSQFQNKIEPEKLEKIGDIMMSNVLGKGAAFLKDDMYLMSAPKQEIDYKVIDAVWVLLRTMPILGSSEIKWIFRADEPAQICYQKNKQMFEIMVLNSDEIVNMVMLEERIKARTNDTSAVSYCNYIIVIQNEEMLQELPQVSYKYVPVILDYHNDYSSEPEVLFYEIQEQGS